MTIVAKQCIRVPGLWSAGGSAHAVRRDELLYTAAIGARDAAGAVAAPGDLAAQARQAHADLGRVLAAAGAGWDRVVKLNYYVAPWACTAAGRQALRAVQAEMLPQGRCAALGVALPLPDPDLAIQVEAIATFDADREAFPAGAGGIAAPGFAAAVRSGDKLYGGVQLALPADADPEEPLAVQGSLGEQTLAVYGLQARLLAASGFRREELLQVHQFLTPRRLALAEFQDARARYLTPGRFLSTSVAGPAEHPDWALSGWLIAVDFEADRRPARPVHQPAVWGNPGGPQGFLTGRLLRMHGQVGRGTDLQTRFADDPAAQAGLAYDNIEAVLDAAGCSWRQVLHIRNFCKSPEALAAVKQLQRARLPAGDYATTDLLADYFDPKLHAEIEVVAVRDEE